MYGMSATTNADGLALVTALTWCSISSTVIDNVSSCPRTTCANESPTKIISISASETAFADG